MRRRTILTIAAAVVVLLVVGAAAAYWVVNRRTADVHNGDKLPFTLTSDPTTSAPSSTQTGPNGKSFGPSWPVYGLSDARTRDDVQADAAGAEHRDRGAGLDLRRPEHGADPGRDRTADECRS